MLVLYHSNTSLRWVNNYADNSYTKHVNYVCVNLCMYTAVLVIELVSSLKFLFPPSLSSPVLWLHTVFTLLYLAIAGAFMIHFSVQLGKHQLDHVSHNITHARCSVSLDYCKISNKCISWNTNTVYHTWVRKFDFAFTKADHQTAKFSSYTVHVCSCV